MKKSKLSKSGHAFYFWHAAAPLDIFALLILTVPFTDPMRYAAKPGRCWPSGHASAGFCLFAWYFAALRLERRRVALYLLAGVIVIGSLLSVGRVAQGAHFVSHCLWSAAVCWFVTLALYEALLRWRPIPALPLAWATPGRAAS